MVDITRDSVESNVCEHASSVGCLKEGCEGEVRTTVSVMEERKAFEEWIQKNSTHDRNIRCAR